MSSLYPVFRRIALGVAFTSFSAFGQQYIVSTVAGSGGSPGWSGDGGPALSAQFTNPIRIAVDKAGSLYITDFSNYSVRKVTKNGIVNTIAGNGSLGFSGDGTSVGAQLSNVLDVAVAADGSVYIADSLNSRIRKIDASGNISTFAGNGSRGYAGDGGLANDASLYFPAGLALDSKGDLYIADYGNATVRKITMSTGRISTVAGVGYSIFGAAPGDGGVATKAFLELPHSVAVDAVGNVFIGDIGTSSIRKVGTDGKISTYLTNFVAQNFAIDGAGVIYFADYRTNTVQKVLPGGNTRLWIGGNGTSGWSGDGGPATAAQFNLPYGVAVDAAGNVFVADAANAVIRQLSPVGFSIGAIANSATLQGFAPPVSGSGDSTYPVAPGELIVIFGAGLGPAAMVTAPSGAALPTTLGGTTVMINGKAAPILYSSATMVSAVVPFSVDGLFSANVAVQYQGKTSNVTTVPVYASAPGMFTADGSGAGQATALNSDGTRNSVSNPALVGSIVTFYITGAGQTNAVGVDGAIYPTGNSQPAPVQPLSVTIGGLPAVVDFVSGAPGMVSGTTRIVTEIPTGFAPGSAIPVQVTVGGTSSQVATIAVSN